MDPVPIAPFAHKWHTIELQAAGLPEPGGKIAGSWEILIDGRHVEEASDGTNGMLRSEGEDPEETVERARWVVDKYILRDRE